LEARYSNASDVIRAAPRLLEEREAKLTPLRDALIEGEESGKSTPFNFEAFIARKRNAKPRMTGRFVLSPRARPALKPASPADIGFAPAALISLPGLVGLAAAIVARIAGVAYLRARRRALAAAEFDATQQLTEVCFYLGALATSAYI
jgi:antitoxin ParD1/3/4